jgi:hypothetical protein
MQDLGVGQKISKFGVGKQVVEIHLALRDIVGKPFSGPP